MSARQILESERPLVLDDKIGRAIGVLKHARLLSSEETLFFLSHLRLGVVMKRVTGVGSGGDQFAVFEYPAGTPAAVCREGSGRRCPQGGASGICSHAYWQEQSLTGFNPRDHDMAARGGGYCVFAGGPSSSSTISTASWTSLGHRETKTPRSMAC